MEFFVYIIYSEKADQYYVGSTADLQDRIFRHNNSGSKSTKKANDWILVYSESFPTRALATQRETQIKKKKSRKFIEELIKDSLRKPG